MAGYVVRWICLVAVAIAVAVGPARAVEPDEILADPALEKRARGLSAELRCLVCQNQSIDDSNAPLARDLRLLVRERLKQGDSDADVRAYVVARYGEFVLLRPPLGASTVLLWLTPLLLLGATLAVIGWRLRLAGGNADLAPVPLAPEEQARLDEILRRDQDGGPSRS
jgi:cytochrome c-type biogenesis protein CcmH